MLQAFRLQQGDARSRIQQMKAALGEPVSSAPADRDAAATTSGWWLRTVVGTGDKGSRPSRHRSRRSRADARPSGSATSGQFTEFDGYVPQPGTSSIPALRQRVLGHRAREGGGAVPYQFFLKRGLGLRPVDDGERDKDVWLDPLTRGSELHDIYAALLRRCRDARPSSRREERCAWLTSRRRTRSTG